MTPISRILSSGRSLPTVNQGPLFESILLLVIQLLSWHIHVTRLALKCFFFFLLQYNKSLTRGMNCVFRGYSEWDYGLVRVRHYFKTHSYVTEIVCAGYWDISVLLCVTWSILLNLLWGDSLSFIFISVLCCKPQEGSLHFYLLHFYIFISWLHFFIIVQLGEMTGNRKREGGMARSKGPLDRLEPWAAAVRTEPQFMSWRSIDWATGPLPCLHF